MARDLNVTIVQTTIHWQDARANRRHFGSLILDLQPNKTDIIVLPETFTTGFTMASEEMSEEMNGKTVGLLTELAATMHAVVCGSLIIREDGKFYNRLVWAQPDGTVKHYNKRHLFRMADEHLSFSGGEEPVIVEWRDWKINLQVCYDLRFPVFSRNRNDNRYDLAIYVANWPEARRHPWSTLLMARAMENQAYVVGVNRIGTDGKDISYSGDSAVIDPKGNVISTTKPYEESVETVTLSMQELNDYREKFPIGLDADDFTIH